MLKHVAFGLLATTLLAGCGGKKSSTAYSDAKTGSSKTTPEKHVHTAPHGGHLIEIKDHVYNAELCFDAKTRDTTVYLLGPHAQKPLAISDADVTINVTQEDNDIELILQAKPQEGDPEGKSSRFVLEGKHLPESIHDEEDFVGLLSVNIKDEYFEAVIKHDDDGDGHKTHKTEHKTHVAKTAVEKTAPKTEATTTPKPEPKTEAKTKPEPKPEPKPEAKTKPEPKPEPKPEAKTKPAPKPEPKPEAKTKPEPKPEPKPEAKTKPEPKPEPKPEAKTKPEPK
ncbi:MAG: hypothetical protein O3A00_13580, partial [Planctomycetota bacterium]|nr:hypothetical protein [Planctomycetota bacterium]